MSTSTKRTITAVLAFVLVGLLGFFAAHTAQQSPAAPALAEDARPADKRAAAFERKKARAEYFFQLLRDPATNRLPDNIRARELA